MKLTKNQSVPIFQEHPVLKDEYLIAYQKALKCSRLKLHEQISFRNVKIYDNDYIHQIHTINDPKLPHLVILHGYGVTSMTCVRLFSQLFSEFQVHALDTFGLGYSSRGQFRQDFDFDQSRNYFINATQLGNYHTFISLLAFGIY